LNSVKNQRKKTKEAEKKSDLELSVTHFVVATRSLVDTLGALDFELSGFGV
jgi:hypothetical protein